jgi:hypothetical protein
MLAKLWERKFRSSNVQKKNIVNIRSHVLCRSLRLEYMEVQREHCLWFLLWRCRYQYSYRLMKYWHIYDSSAQILAHLWQQCTNTGTSMTVVHKSQERSLRDDWFFKIAPNIFGRTATAFNPSERASFQAHRAEGASHHQGSRVN